METGNPKQLAVLGVMAVGAIGFLVVRLGGKGKEPVALANVVAKREAKAAPTIFAIARDPFSHPRLAPKTDKPALEPAFSPFGAVKSPASPSPAPLGGSFAPGGSIASLGPLPATGGGMATVDAASSAAPTQEAAKPAIRSTTTIALEAIAGASEDRVAFLSVGGADSQPFRPKDPIAGAIRLLRVGDGTVVLEGPAGRATLEVGDKRSL